MKRLLTLCILLVGPSVFGQTQLQPSGASQPGLSLGDSARQMREQQGKPAGSTPAKVYTNDDVDVLRGLGGVSVTKTDTSAKTTSSGPHGEKYFRRNYSKLEAQRELHVRQLDVLEKKLSQNELQYYPDPNKALLQQYTREDLNKRQELINAMKLQLQGDDQALSDLQDELRHASGNPAWLTGAPIPLDQLSAEVQPDVPPGAPKNSKAQKPTKDYWQGQFKSARTNLAKAHEVQNLVEDEISLLKMRQVQEKPPEAQKEISDKLASRDADLQAALAATDRAKTVLDDLQKLFDASGEPQDWSVTE